MTETPNEGGIPAASSLQQQHDQVVVPVLSCPYENCKHKWIPRVPNPLRCPKCRRLLDVEQVKKRDEVRLVHNRQPELTTEQLVNPNSNGIEEDEANVQS